MTIVSIVVVQQINIINSIIYIGEVILRDIVIDILDLQFIGQLVNLFLHFSQFFVFVFYCFIQQSSKLFQIFIFVVFTRIFDMFAQRWLMLENFVAILTFKSFRFWYFTFYINTTSRTWFESSSNLILTILNFGWLTFLCFVVSCMFCNFSNSAS